MAVNVGAGGQVQAGLGLQIAAQSPQLTPARPAFWTYILLAVLIIAIVAIASSLR